MDFRDPSALALAAVLVGAALVLFSVAAQRRRRALAAFLGTARWGAEADALRPVVRRRRAQAGLLVGALACLGFALAGPLWGEATREARQESLDLIVALDVSESMRVEDVAPSRLERAKLEIERIVEARRGDRVGLVVFAGAAFLQCPLTTDRGALRLFLDAADPEQVPVQGTDFATALSVAARAFDDSGSGEPERPRALLVVSDGEDHEGGLSGAAALLRESGVEILALGVGTEAGGPIPDVERGRAAGVKRDRQGREVVSRFADGALRTLAGRGDLFRLGRRGAAAPDVNAALDRLDRAVLAQERYAAGADRYQWPLALGLLLLAAERWLAVRPRQPAAS